jgi:hypothetical protein
MKIVSNGVFGKSDIKPSSSITSELINQLHSSLVS